MFKSNRPDRTPYGIQDLETRPLANYYRKMVRNPVPQEQGYSGTKDRAYKPRQTERSMHITAKTFKQVPCVRSIFDDMGAQIKRLNMLQDRRDRRNA